MVYDFLVLCIIAFSDIFDISLKILQVSPLKSFFFLEGITKSCWFFWLVARRINFSDRRLEMGEVVL